LRRRETETRETGDVREVPRRGAGRKKSMDRSTRKWEKIEREVGTEVSFAARIRLVRETAPNEIGRQRVWLKGGLMKKSGRKKEWGGAQKKKRDQLLPFLESALLSD